MKRESKLKNTILVIALLSICACNKEQVGNTVATSSAATNKVYNAENVVTSNVPTINPTSEPTEKPEPTPTVSPISVKTVKLSDEVTIKVEMGEKECSICKITAKKSCRKIVIPGKVDGKPVTKIEYEYRWQPIEDSTYNIFGKENNNSDVEEGTPEDWYEANNKNIEEIILPDSIRRIKGYSFMGLTGLRKIKLPKNLEKISTRTFARCSRLTRIDIPKKCKKFGMGAFILCSNLKRIHIQKGNKNYVEIGDCILKRDKMYMYTFANFKKNIVIPKEVKGFCGDSFNYFKPSTITLSKKNKYLKMRSNCLYEKKTGKLVFVKSNSKREVKVPNGVKVLGKEIAVVGYVNKITLPKTVRVWCEQWARHMYTEHGNTESTVIVVKGNRVPRFKGNGYVVIPIGVEFEFKEKVARKYNKLFKKHGCRIIKTNQNTYYSDLK
ncbi:leucine-rich repeat domain-containing protein [Eubacterium xylanophilum]|uniref:leucine-rich repeat domain-containing protein n=1 Tax=Eubacterium xylanophilum TaxID=39497 RepID=UPI00047CBF84|nr:leucine-rich repeat domain-containing protein [Eubacterium xylanophilum]